MTAHAYTICPHCDNKKPFPSGDIVYWTAQECSNCGAVSVSPQAITKAESKSKLEQYEVKIKKMKRQIDLLTLGILQEKIK